MYEDQTYDIILERMMNRVPDKLDKRPSSLIYDTHSSTAIELQILYIELETLIQNSYGDTAAREFLILLAKDRGLSPEPATNAVLKGEFTPTTIDVTGKRFNIGDLNYIVTEKIADGQYQMQCESIGEVGNQYLGQMIPIDYIDGLETAQLTEVLIPGEDEEDTEVFRQRYYNSFDSQVFGGNKQDYLEKVNSISGVGSSKITRVWNNDIRPTEMIPNSEVQSWYETFIQSDGLNDEVKNWLTTVYNAALLKKLTVGGTVLVTIVDSDDYGKASDTLVNTVQNIIDPDPYTGEGEGLAPIGHVVKVQSAESVALQIETTITFSEGYSWSNCQVAIEEAVNAYLLELRKEWSNSTQLIVRVSQIDNHILNVKGVIDVTDTNINGQTSNLTLTEFQIPVLGGVSA
nr:MAG TPA: Baseplate J like protein [Caudoviricetes sp.]